MQRCDGHLSSQGVGRPSISRHIPRLLPLLLLLVSPRWIPAVAQPLDLPLDSLQLPEGFTAQLYSDQTVPAARHLALGLSNSSVTIVYVSSKLGGGAVTALVDRGSDGVVDTSCQLLRDLNIPNGIAWHQGALYVAEITQITKFEGVDEAVLRGCNADLVTPTLITDAPPSSQRHGFRALALGPDGRLYVNIGAPFNIGVCEGVFCSVQTLPLEGGGLEPFVTGVRNVGDFAWHPSIPGTFLTVLERDMMGDNMPDDLVMRVVDPPQDLGFPYCHWVGAGAPELRESGPGWVVADIDMAPPGINPPEGVPHNESFGEYCAETTPPPFQSLGPHVSPLGLAFYPPTPEDLPSTDMASRVTAAQGGGPPDGSDDSDPPPSDGGMAGSPGAPPSLWPQRYRGQLFVAEHGSWNRDVPLGYRISMIEMTPEGRAVGHAVFASGWLPEGSSSGGASWDRPVGLLVLPDGSMLVAGDKAGAVYRILYRP